MNAKFNITGRAILSLNGTPIVDFRPFFGGEEHSSGGCTNAEWEMRGVVVRRQKDDSTEFTLFTGGCCSGCLMEGRATDDGKVHMGAVLRMVHVPQVVIPIIFHQEGKDRHAMSYLVAHSSEGGDAVSSISWYHNQGMLTELITAPAESLCGGTSHRKALPYGILTAYPQLFDLVEKQGIGRGQVAKESMLKWASEPSHIKGAHWCDQVV